MLQAVIFDLDGTLLDTLRDLRSAVNHVMAEHYFPVCTLDQVRSYVGNGVAALIRRACPEGTPEAEVEQCLAEFRRWYFDHVLVETAPYAGIPEMLMRLKEMNLRLGVVSNKFEAAVCKLCDETLPGLMDSCIGDLPGYPRKPDPANIHRCMNALGVSDPADILYVGDSEADIRTAENAGLSMITVTWGFRDKELLRRENAPCMVDTVEELVRAIEKRMELAQSELL